MILIWSNDYGKEELIAVFEGWGQLPGRDSLLKWGPSKCKWNWGGIGIIFQHIGDGTSTSILFLVVFSKYLSPYMEKWLPLVPNEVKVNCLLLVTVPRRLTNSFYPQLPLLLLLFSGNMAIIFDKWQYLKCH